MERHKRLPQIEVVPHEVPCREQAERQRAERKRKNPCSAAAIWKHSSGIHRGGKGFGLRELGLAGGCGRNFGVAAHVPRSRDGVVQSQFLVKRLRHRIARERPFPEPDEAYGQTGQRKRQQPVPIQDLSARHKHQGGSRANE
jgi:hypothetical protein